MARTPVLAAVAAAAIGLGVGAWFAFPGLFPGGAGDDRFADCRSTSVSGASVIGGPFSLIDQTGAPVTDKDVIDRLSLVYFGYTYCPDVCPVDAARNAEAVEILDERGIALRPVFISIDPGRDTPETMAEFVGALHPRMIGLTGSQAAIDAVTKAYRVYAAKAGDDDQDYLMDHSTFAYLMAPGSVLLDVYGRDVTPTQMADSVQCFADRL